MDEPLRFDVYGILQVALRPGADGWWIAERIGSDGKRRHLPEVLIPPGTSPDQVPDFLEAVFHESARPGTKIELIP